MTPGRHHGGRAHQGIRRAAVACTAILLLSTGCSMLTPPGSDGDASHRSSVQVDTPELRDAKAATDLPDCAPGAGSHGDSTLPAITLPCLGGGADVNVSTLRGPMVINLWASWCPPCRRELPIYEKFFQKHGDQVAVLGIDFNDAQPGAALELARETGISYPQLADPNTDLALAGPLPNFPGLPAMIFIDADGSVVDDSGTPRVAFEEIDSVGELEGLVEKHLGITLGQAP
ncbi:TlpA family protein disulfide reductase [Nocardioides daejeonensis]|uniref:TlpA family protein disulfide reductase n=1 Tax=Nocardioides daejeonensis TaxID=1046556 RepID=UPI0013A56BF9|nr:TlpA disulfide reductase family protein [Nocardioides daejeonensis]